MFSLISIHNFINSGTFIFIMESKLHIDGFLKNIGCKKNVSIFMESGSTNEIRHQYMYMYYYFCSRYGGSFIMGGGYYSDHC